MIEFRKLSKAFKDKIIFSDCDFVFPDHGLVLVEGENGSGKSTLFSLLSGFDLDYRGEILVDGKDIKAMSEEELCQYRKNTVGIVFQNHSLVDYLRGEENAGMYSLLEGRKIGDRGRSLKKYSSGEKMKLALRRELGQEKEIYLFDEVTNTLDDEAFHRFFDFIKEHREKSLILVVTHDDRFLSLREDRLRIEDGRFVYKRYGSSDSTKQQESASQESGKDRKRVLPKTVFNKHFRRHWFSFAFLTLAMTMLYMVLIFPLFSATYDYGAFFARTVDRDTLVSTRGNTEELDESTDRCYPAVGGTLISSAVPADGRIHVPESSKDEFLRLYQNTFSSPDIYVSPVFGTDLSLSFSFDKDSSLPENAFFTNPSTLEHIGSSNLSQDRYSIAFSLSVGGQKRDFTDFALPSYLKLSDLTDASLKDDTFYLPQNDPLFRSAGFSSVMEIEDNAWLVELFPDGVEIEPVSCSQDRVSEICYVNSNTMGKIIRASLRWDDTRVVFYDVGNTKVASAICRSGLFYAYGMFYRSVYGNTTKVGREIDQVVRGIRFAGQFIGFSIAFGIVSFLLLFLLKASVLVSLSLSERMNRHLFLSFGLRKKQLLPLSLIPFVISETISLPLAYVISMEGWFVRDSLYGGYLAPTWLGCTILLSIAFFSTLAAYLLYLKMMEWKTPKLFAGRKVFSGQTPFSVFNQRNLVGSGLFYLVFILLSFVQFMMLYLGSYGNDFFGQDIITTALLYGLFGMMSLFPFVILMHMKLSYERNSITLTMLNIRGVGKKNIDAYFRSLLFLGCLSLLIGHVTGMVLCFFMTLIWLRKVLPVVPFQTIYSPTLLIPYLSFLVIALALKRKSHRSREKYQLMKEKLDD